MEDLKYSRDLLKSSIFDEIGDTIKTAQQNGLPQPSIQKPIEDGKIIDLPSFDSISNKSIGFVQLLQKRESRRIYSNTPISLEELSFLLWSAQGLRKEPINNKYTFRTAPSGGARHPFELYIAVLNINGLEAGIYRYLPLEHKLLYTYTPENLSVKLSEACYGQKFVSNSAVVFIWTAIPYRTEWRYSLASSKLILLDAGHSCQNLYLSCEFIDAGTCAIASYDQEISDKLLNVDGNDEFVVYIAPVGKIK